MSHRRRSKVAVSQPTARKFRDRSRTPQLALRNLPVGSHRPTAAREAARASWNAPPDGRLADHRLLQQPFEARIVSSASRTSTIELREVSASESIALLSLSADDETLEQKARRKESRMSQAADLKKWRWFAPLGLSLIGAGASVTAYASQLMQSGGPDAPWNWIGAGTLGLVILNAGVSIFGDAVKCRAKIELRRERIGPAAAKAPAATGSDRSVPPEADREPTIE